MPSGHKVSASNVKKACEMLKGRLIVYLFKPAERDNEGELVRQLSVCRVPLSNFLRRQLQQRRHERENGHG